jgi:hypothetical protein
MLICRVAVHAQTTSHSEARLQINGVELLRRKYKLWQQVRASHTLRPQEPFFRIPFFLMLRMLSPTSLSWRCVQLPRS